MPIIQTTIWVCEECSHHSDQTEEARAFSDPVIELPLGWDYLYEGNTAILLCNSCLTKAHEKPNADQQP